MIILEVHISFLQDSEIQPKNQLVLQELISNVGFIVEHALSLLV